MDNHLKSEIWETQVILYWILSVMLFNSEHRILGYITLVWGIISFIGAIFKKFQAVAEDKAEAKYGKE